MISMINMFNILKLKGDEDKMHERYEGERGVDYLLGPSTGRYNERGPSSSTFSKSKRRAAAKVRYANPNNKEVYTAPSYRSAPVTFNILAGWMPSISIRASFAI
jgi:hypothetical protein